MMMIMIDYLVLSKLVFDWADSYDAKVNFSFRDWMLFTDHPLQDWDRLRSIIAPTLTVSSL